MMKFIALIGFGHDTYGRYGVGDEWRGDETEGERLRRAGYLEAVEGSGQGVATPSNEVAPAARVRKQRGA